MRSTYDVVHNITKAALVAGAMQAAPTPWDCRLLKLMDFRLLKALPGVFALPFCALEAAASLLLLLPGMPGRALSTSCAIQLQRLSFRQAAGLAWLYTRHYQEAHLWSCLDSSCTCYKYLSLKLTGALSPLEELLRLKLFLDRRPKALGSTIPPGGGRGVIGGRLLPGVKMLSASPFEPVPALHHNSMGGMVFPGVCICLSLNAQPCWYQSYVRTTITGPSGVEARFSAWQPCV